MAEVLFWTAASILAYVYVGYPFIVRVLASVAGKPVRCVAAQYPSITVIISAYNEEKNIRAKIDHVLSLDYPAALLNIIVVSDASTDATDQIVERCKPDRVELLRIEGRRGKTACQNAAAERARGEVLIFTDATTRIETSAFKAIVENFADPKVGCVAGLLVYQGKGHNLTAAGGVSYWRYEVTLRLAESRLGTLIGVSGCLYAVRRQAYRPISLKLVSDFVIAMRMREQGLRTILEPRAICFEDTLDQPRNEFSMRVRVAIRSIGALVEERRFLNIFAYPLFAWQLWSHKVLRYFSPYWLLVTLVTCLILSENPLYRAVLIVQSVAFGAGVAGFALQLDARRHSLLSKPYYFLLTNLASLVATLRYLNGDRMVTWLPLRE
jgi:cellulose synthase/poly-beta-1,6-N-acetylglucosamine synthase-like glycosyltransferase